MIRGKTSYMDNPTVAIPLSIDQSGLSTLKLYADREFRENRLDNFQHKAILLQYARTIQQGRDKEAAILETLKLFEQYLGDYYIIVVEDNFA